MEAEFASKASWVKISGNRTGFSPCFFFPPPNRSRWGEKKTFFPTVEVSRRFRKRFVARETRATLAALSKHLGCRRGRLFSLIRRSSSAVTIERLAERVERVSRPFFRKGIDQRRFPRVSSVAKERTASPSWSKLLLLAKDRKIEKWGWKIRYP